MLETVQLGSRPLAARSAGNQRSAAFHLACLPGLMIRLQRFQIILGQADVITLAVDHQPLG
jgi:hypothetical protein